MKKKIVAIVSLLVLTFSLFAQDKYVIVPIKLYKYDKIDIYGLSSLTNQLFAKSGYKVFTENQLSWPKELQANPCLAIYTETEDVSPLIGLTKVKITLKNCYKQKLAESIGKDNDVDNIKALHIALEEAFNNLKTKGKIASCYANLSKAKDNYQTPEIASTIKPKAKVFIKKPVIKNNSTKAAEISSEKKDKTTSLEEVQRHHWKKYTPVEIEGIYSYANKNYVIKYVDKGFELISPNQIKLALLQKTSKDKIYRVLWENGIFDIAYLKDNGTLVIEQSQDEQIEVWKLEKIFPNE